MPAAPRNVAVVHDWLVDRAGAERVLEEILALFPDAVLYTLIDRLPAADATRLPRRATVTSWLQKLPGVERYFTRCLPLMPMAVQQFDLSGHDLVISSSHCVAKGVLVPPEALHLCYCHSPMRYAWDMQHEYLRTEHLDRGPKSWLARRMFHRLRAWDAYTANGVDHFAANSEFVRRRILKAYRREAVVIHPPVEVAPPSAPGGERQGYVTVGRLMGYKNTALMVEAFRRLPQRQLTVVGGGPQLQALRRSAPSNVRFTGPLPEAQKQVRLQGARAFVFAAVEDFGIAPVEALAAGTPVIAFGRGGALDYLRHGDNAWLYAAPTPEALAEAILASESAWPADVHERCRRSAERFGAGRFRAEFAAWVDARWDAWCEAGAR
ncbi:glycosyltransferase involved in cell wall biosynthesis [Rubrivivax gelatinosus]|uniref:glycosyltransferase n=1 Tax=Rubrivivax gelatinosus TaxID=28068 RepID=UPI0006801B96|nr:glycosyltransferase [Rubrivivax gelatinosus]MBG6079903.1 glycosyltransferase involved in cell wall biosynthesis [Rubrivivax gelatinosus]